MKTLLMLCFLAIASLATAQDYYAIAQESENTVYHYPANVEMVIISPNEEMELVGSNPDILLEGDYRIEISTSWNKDKEVIKCNGKSLKIYRVTPEVEKDEANFDMSGMLLSQEEVDRAMANKPFLEKKTISKSMKKEGAYNLEAKFSNDLTFSYQDGEVYAFRRGDELVITNRYLVETPQGTLKLSFDPSDGEFWYVFEI